MKVDLIYLPQPISINFFFGSVTQIFVGMPIPHEGGGGTVGSIDIDERSNRALIKKTGGCEGWKGRKEFARKEVMVLMLPPGSSYAIDADEIPAKRGRPQQDAGGKSDSE